MQIIKWYTTNVTEVDSLEPKKPSKTHLLVWLDDDIETHEELYKVLTENRRFDLEFDEVSAGSNDTDKVALIVSFKYDEVMDTTYNDFKILSKTIEKVIKHFNNNNE